MRLLTHKQTEKQKSAHKNPVRKMALVIDEVQEGRVHKYEPHCVYFLRKAGIKRWVCDCKDFLIRRIALGRHCKHIRYAKGKI